MRDSYYFYGDMNPESVRDFLYFCNGDEKPIDFYIDSPGGLVSSYKVLLDTINKQEDLIVYPIGEASSCAFYLLLNVNQKIKLIDESIVSYIHFPRRDIKIDYNHQLIVGDDDDHKNFLIRSKEDELTKQLYNIKLDRVKKNKLMAGKDIMFNINDLKKILNGKLITN